MKRIRTTPALIRKLATGTLPVACVLLVVSAILSRAEQRDRLSGPVTGGNSVPLRGSRNPRIDKLVDEGALPAMQRISGLRLRFKPTAEQSAALDRLLEEQQIPESPLYHRWLTPEEYAERFGPSANDLARIAQWLDAEGFQIDATARSRGWIAFSGAAYQVRRTFRTEIHRFHTAGQRHFANVEEAHVPAELESIVQSLSGLDDLRPAASRTLKARATAPASGHALTPADLAVIYNATPLLEKGFDGFGQKIAVAGGSAIELSDVRKFRSRFRLPENDPHVILAGGSVDPGVTDFYEEGVADVEIAGAAAPRASILYVYAPNPFDAVEYAVDQNLAPVVSYSFYGCEKEFQSSPANLNGPRAVAKQANAQGITLLAASGDAGAASCEVAFRDVEGRNGAWVSVPASFPEATAVGATMFADDTGDHWNGDPQRPGTARSYIPETAWNETSLTIGLAASGGGASYMFPRPAWQSGPGVPGINMRLVPDVSFAGGWNQDPYIIVTAGEPWSWGGTSAATPYFAGALAILNQYVTSSGFQPKPGLGNINPRLYELARNAPTAFHDITAGNNIVPCRPGSDDCEAYRYGFLAGRGYDPVTGLGSLDIHKFVLQWAAAASTPAGTPTALTLTANPPTVAANALTVMTAAVKGAAGATPRGGSVSFSLGQTALGTAELSASGTTAIATLTVNGSQLAAGVNTIRASYGGTSSFSPSSGTADVTVAGAAAVVVATAQPSTVYQQAPDVDGFGWQYRLQLMDTGGLPSTITEFYIDETNSTDRISALFGATTLPAYGSLSAAMRGKISSPPAIHSFSFAGIDSSGKTWRRQVTVRFEGRPESAALSLFSSPAIVRQTLKGDPNCPADRPLFQQLSLQESNGVSMHLTKFVADGKDLSDQVDAWFGSLRLPPFGSLRANVCWSATALPASREYEIEGIDSNGQTVRARLQVPFRPMAPGAGILSIAKKSVELAAASAVTAALVDLTVPADELWSISVAPANSKSRWLTVAPMSGRGPVRVSLAASASGLSPGMYTTTLMFQSENTVPQLIALPVVLTVGASGKTVITGAQNGASFQPVFAPGMLMTVYGTQLADSTQTAKAQPLPLTLDGVSATVNGLPAPLWFVSPSQVNLQIPYETPTGSTLVVVNNNGNVASYPIQVTAAAPGIFSQLPDTASRGDSVSLYLTGAGEVTPMLETGAAPPANTPPAQLPKPRLGPQVTVGGIPAEVTFIRSSGLVGVTELQFTIPTNVTPGAQPVVVTLGSVSSPARALMVR